MERRCKTLLCIGQYYKSLFLRDVLEHFHEEVEELADAVDVHALNR